MNTDFEVVVVGAGPIGLTTAMLLVAAMRNRAARALPSSTGASRRRWTRARFPSTCGCSRLSRASEKILRAADAWSDIRAVRTCSYERMQVWHADVPPHGGEALVFDAAEMGERDLGVIAENQVLQAALAAAARRAGIALLQGELETLDAGRDCARAAHRRT